MEMVIKISDTLMEYIIKGRDLSEEQNDEMACAIADGIPLPIAERYKPIILQEHDAEPRTLRAILDTATDEIYICRLTRQGAEFLGMTIEDRNDDEEVGDKE